VADWLKIISYCKITVLIITKFQFAVIGLKSAGSSNKCSGKLGIL